MADKKKHAHLFLGKDTGLGTPLQQQIISQLPDQVQTVQERFYQSEENLLRRHLPQAEIQISTCLDNHDKDPMSLLKNVVRVFESVLSNAMDAWVKSSLTNKPVSLEVLIDKINNDNPPNNLKDIALALKSLYNAYPDPHHKIFAHKNKLLPLVNKIEPAVIPQHHKKFL